MKRIILDLDVGTDDALALLVLLRAEREGLVKIEALCCTRGNASVEDVCKNVVRILEIVGRTDIPVYKGSEEELVRFESEYRYFHGEDGFGDLEYDSEPDLSIVRDEPSAVAMNQIVSRSPGEIYLVCLGPLTNAALAMKLYKDFAASVREIYLMGGNFQGIGNVTKTAEYNFFMDPEAAHIVLSSTKCPVTIVPWETCTFSKITMDWRFNILGDVEDKMIELLNKAEESVYKERKSEYWLPCDAYLAIAFLYSESIVNVGTYHAAVELAGRETRGQVVLDRSKKKESNVCIVEHMDEDFVKNILLATCRCGFDK